MLNGSIFIGIRGSVERGGLVRWMTNVGDATALPAYEQRSVTGPRVLLAVPHIRPARRSWRRCSHSIEQIDRARSALGVR